MRDFVEGGISLSDSTIELTFVHPTNRSETLIASVSDTGTPTYLIEQLIAADFISPPGAVGEYKLRTENGTQLLDDRPIGEQGLRAGALLTIDHNMSGAKPVGR